MGQDNEKPPRAWRAVKGGQHYGFTRTQTYNFMRDGLLPYRQVGRARIVEDADFKALLASFPVMRAGVPESQSDADATDAKPNTDQKSKKSAAHHGAHVRSSHAALG